MLQNQLRTVCSQVLSRCWEMSSNSNGGTKSVNCSRLFTCHDRRNATSELSRPSLVACQCRHPRVGFFTRTSVRAAPSSGYGTYAAAPKRFAGPSVAPRLKSARLATAFPAFRAGWCRPVHLDLPPPPPPPSSPQNRRPSGAPRPAGAGPAASLPAGLSAQTPSARQARSLRRLRHPPSA